MAINFCQTHHAPKLSCNQVAADGFEVVNLISSKSSNGLKGFRSEYFIKPPVDITFSLDIPIEVSHIVLGLRNGSLRVTGIEIWTKPRIDVDVYYPVGKCLISDAASLCFVNKAYVPSASFQQFRVEHPENGEVRYLRGKHHSHLSSVSHVLVRITRTANSCVPTLSVLEIWGQPARTCNQEVTRKFVEAENNARSTPSSDDGHSSDGAVLGNLGDSDNNESNPTVPDNTSEIEIPQEFIDPISCEFMALPMLLPSGQTIDRSSLDKFLEAESAWGRPPSDPFTGVRLRKGQDAIPNVALKARIDQFLVKNSSRLKNVPRTVGHHKSLSEKRISDIRCSLNVPGSGFEQELQTSRKSEKPDYLNGVQTHAEVLSKCETETMACLPKGENTGTKNALLDAGSSDQASKKQKSHDEMTFKTTEQIQGDCCQSHEDRLSSSLNTSLKSTLSGLQNFTTKQSWTTSLPSSQLFPKCSSCTLEMKFGQFSLPCSHSLCRSCLFKKKEDRQLVCSVCNHVFKPSEVLHCHQ